MGKIAIFRTSVTPLDLTHYNIQEIGFAKALLNKGFTVDIYSRFTNIKKENVFKKEKNNHIKLIPITGLNIRGRIVDFSLKQKILNSDYDIVQTHEDSQIMTPFLLKWAKKKKAATVLYQGGYQIRTDSAGIIQKVYTRFFINKIKKYCDYCLSKTETAEQYLIKMGLKKNNFILPVGLDFDREFYDYKDFDQIAEFRSQFEHLLLYIGKIEKRRNNAFLLDILNALNNKNIGLLSIGHGPDMDDLRAKIKNLKLTSQVHFIREIPNNQLKQIYELADILLLPSLYEPFGMVILESLYFGLPVIASKTAGPLEILKAKELGVCLELDSQTWAQHIKHYFEMKNYKDYRRKHVLSNHNWDNIAEQYLDVVFMKKQGKSRP